MPDLTIDDFTSCNFTTRYKQLRTIKESESVSAATSVMEQHNVDYCIFLEKNKPLCASVSYFLLIIKIFHSTVQNAS